MRTSLRSLRRHSSYSASLLTARFDEDGKGEAAPLALSAASLSRDPRRFRADIALRGELVIVAADKCPPLLPEDDAEGPACPRREGKNPEFAFGGGGACLVKNRCHG